MAADRSVPPGLLARVRLVHGLVPNVTVAAMLGLDQAEFYRRREALGLSPSALSNRPRRALKAGSKSSAAKNADRRKPPRRVASSTAPPAGPGEPIDRLAVGRAMERFISGRVAAYEAAADAGDDPEPERTARTVAHYARALGLVRSYLNDIEKERSIDGESPARTLSELRDELRGHLERIWDEGADAGGLRCPGDEPGGD